MRSCFVSRQWRWPSIIWALLALELPFTVANLALFGIASPNLYRSILWTEGGKLGLNSDPTTVLYAAANYRPVKIPIVWSSFNTQYNLVIGVLCMFFYLIKCTGWLLHILWPIISLPMHVGLLALWAASIRIQTAPDTIDPDRINNGAPWYITKSCKLASSSTIEKYCMQAKASFAVSVIMLGIYAIHVLLALYSLIWPSAAARSAYETKRAAKIAEKEKWAHLERSPVENEMTAEEQWQHMWELQQLPRTPGATNGMRSPMTPRTMWDQQQMPGTPGTPRATGGMKSPMTPRTQTFGEMDGNNQGWYAPTQAGYQEPQATGLGVQHGGYAVQGQQQYGDYPTPHPHVEYPAPQANGQYPAAHDLDEHVPDRKAGNAY